VRQRAASAERARNAPCTGGAEARFAEPAPEEGLPRYWRARLQLAVRAGLRPNELPLVNRRNVDRDRQIIVLPENLSRTGRRQRGTKNTHHLRDEEIARETLFPGFLFDELDASDATRALRESLGEPEVYRRFEMRLEVFEVDPDGDGAILVRLSSSDVKKGETALGQAYEIFAMCERST
jgi:hypothetical protein